MTIFDYLKKNCEVAIYTDEYGNTYMEKFMKSIRKLRSLLPGMSQSIPFEMSAGPITG